MVCCTTKTKYVIFWPRSITIAFDTQSQQMNGANGTMERRWKEEFSEFSVCYESQRFSVVFCCLQLFICCLNDELCIGCFTKHSDSRQGLDCQTCFQKQTHTHAHCCLRPPYIIRFIATVGPPIKLFLWPHGSINKLNLPAVSWTLYSRLTNM